MAAAEAETGIADLGGLMEGAFAQGPPIYGGSDQIQHRRRARLGLPASHAPTGAWRSRTAQELKPAAPVACRRTYAGDPVAPDRSYELRPRARGAATLGLGAAGGQVGGSPQAVDGLVLAEHLAGDGDLVHLGGTVRREALAPISIPKGISFDTPSAVQVQRAAMFESTFGIVAFTAAMSSDAAVVLVPVDQPRRAQHEKAELLELDPTVGDLLLHDLQRRQRPVTRLPGQGRSHIMSKARRH